MAKLHHDHLIEIDDQSGQLTIWRVDPVGRKTLYTTVELPVTSDSATLDGFCRMLGENILLDTPTGRRRLLGQ